MRQFAVLTLGLGLAIAGCATGSGDVVGTGAGEEGGAGDGGSPSNGGAPNNGGSPNNNVTTNTTNTTNTSTSTTNTSTGTQMGCQGFECANSQCISAAQECDGTTHCADGSDEAPYNPSCPSTSTTSTGTGGGGCDPFFEITCGDGSCVFIIFVCDGFNDCSDGSDEVGCGGGGNVPPEWTCPTGYYAAADGCDCGCGAVDPDCASTNVDACDYCEDGCSMSACPGTVNATNNAICN